jgi:4-hydroxy-tetrahydrodipicolinate synthase
VVAGVGTNDTRHTVDAAREAAQAGAHGLLVVTPYYNKPPQAGLLAHFLTVADATDLPVMLYDIPGRTGTAIRTETLVRAAEHERILAVKDAKGDLYEGAWVMARTDLAFYSGDDAANLAWLAHGAAGLVSVVAHVAGRPYRAMVEAVLEGDLTTAQRLYRELLPAVRGIMTRTQGAIMAKAALQLQGVLSSRAVRLPLVAATADEVALLKTDLSDSALLEARA